MKDKTPANITANSQIATFAGGCFWCIDHAFSGRAGILSSVSGYAGGTKETADYSQVCSGKTAHREAVQITFDPTKISYKQLLEIFWQQIDPTDSGGQFADRGHHYSTAIFYHNDEQKSLAEASKQAVHSSGRFTDPIVTEILPYTTFFPAEEEHQNFAAKRAEYYQNYKKGSGRAGFIEENWGE